MRKPPLLRDRVIAAAAPGVAARETPERKPGARDGHMTLDRLGGVIRAARQVPARGSQHRGYEELIDPDQTAQQKRQHSSLSSLSQARRATFLIDEPRPRARQ